METLYKNFPPHFVLEDLPLDVHWVQCCQALNENILRFAGGHSQASYICLNSGGVTGKAYTGTSVDLQYLGTAAFKLPCGSPSFQFSYLAKASVASMHQISLIAFPSTVPFIYDTTTLGTYQAAGQVIYTKKLTSTSKQWYSSAIQTPVGWDHIQLVVAVSAYDTTSTTTTLYSHQVEQENVQWA